MRLENEFVVPVGVDQAWAALNDPAKVAPCFPGATLESVDGDSFVGSVKLKLGPISMVYKGTGTFVERDAAAHRVVIDATGRDSRGGGHAKATVTGTLDDRGASTGVRLVTDLTITGRPAQLGRGMISEVSNKIVTQFAACLADTLGSGPTTAPGPTPEPVHELDTTVAGAGSTDAPVEFTDTSASADAGVAAAAIPDPAPPATAATTPPADATPTPTPTSTSAPAPAPAPATAPAPRRSADHIDLLETAGASVAKRLVPAFLIVVVIVIVAVWLITR